MENTRRSDIATTRRSSPRSKFASKAKTAVVDSINGDSNVPFCKGTRQCRPEGYGRTGRRSRSTRRTARRGRKPLVGHHASWNYFMSLRTQERQVREDVPATGRRRRSCRTPTRSSLTTRWKYLHRHPRIVTGGREGQSRPIPTRSSPPWPARPSGAERHRLQDGRGRTTTASRCSSAK